MRSNVTQSAVFLHSILAHSCLQVVDIVCVVIVMCRLQIASKHLLNCKQLHTLANSDKCIHINKLLGLIQDFLTSKKNIILIVSVKIIQTKHKSNIKRQKRRK